MKAGMIKNLICLFAIFGGAVGYAQESTSNHLDQSGAMRALVSTGKSVKLISRYTGGDYVTAAYSFRYLTQDVSKTRNNWELLFEAREDFEDYFAVNTVVDDNSFIYDLGQKSCADIKSAYPEDRQNRPLVWLAYSDADPSNLEPTRQAKVQVGHCYLTYNNDEDGRVVSLFHVQAHEKSRTVTIDEIEVLDVLSRQ